MNDWSSYQLQDFIPFTVDIYLRLLERLNESFWPLQILTLLLGISALCLAIRHHSRLLCLLLAPIWAFVGYGFFIQHYAELNWAGGNIGYFFFAQSLLLLLVALSGAGVDKSPVKQHILTTLPVVIGWAIVLAGLIALPMLSVMIAHTWTQAEIFGIHADPTAITTLGFVLIVFSGWRLWLLSLIPALWLLISALTWTVLGTTWSLILFSVLATALLGLLCKSVAGWMMKQDQFI
ncbi:hypothetical protein MPL1_02978 [Methylophaga lonarensis MPL]|uniref:MFS transporter permease n=1 Tax=Methylophaga lonarensis MPL TaxID=1286106 RepID=M7PTT0_9GAMM|nr:DUF6064 family protein [Methylophaga lonarensis]EMR13859.1 hypothetical protein MPL1_02978 [Methylophaga lonarensis MPL]